ncbi:MAG: TIGR03862 family flavoprotein [Pseudomonadota bacterium]
MKSALVIGAGPAGLMAADELARAGIHVVVADAKPSVGRKFLMAGKSGLNLTKAEPFDAFLTHYHEAAEPLRHMIEAFDSAAVQDWAQSLGQEVFTGSSGRVFPKVMKASPLLRAWLRHLGDLGVDIRTGWRWTGWDTAFHFETPTGSRTETPDATVLALGGASWARLGSDGAWTALFASKDLPFAPFKPANMGLKVDWSDHMAKHFGKPLKGIALIAGGQRVKAEAVLSQRGLEGGGIYAISRKVRDGAALHIDLQPDLSVDQIRARLSKPRGKASLSNHLRKALRLDPVKQALLMEFARPLPDDLAPCLKALPIRHAGPRPMDEAISTAGGVPFDALTRDLMLNAAPGVFCAGEMLDWEAPTGGYLITGCLATGRWAGRSAARWLKG